jgi:hypothetical protein
MSWLWSSIVTGEKMEYKPPVVPKKQPEKEKTEIRQVSNRQKLGTRKAAKAESSRIPQTTKTLQRQEKPDELKKVDERKKQKYPDRPLYTRGSKLVKTDQKTSPTVKPDILAVQTGLITSLPQDKPVLSSCSTVQDHDARSSLEVSSKLDDQAGLIVPTSPDLIGESLEVERSDKFDISSSVDVQPSPIILTLPEDKTNKIIAPVSVRADKPSSTVLFQPKTEECTSTVFPQDVTDISASQYVEFKCVNCDSIGHVFQECEKICSFFLIDSCDEGSECPLVHDMLTRHRIRDKSRPKH